MASTGTPTPAAPPPQTFPYDYLFKVLIIGDASVGKVRSGGKSQSLAFVVDFANCLSYFPLSSCFCLIRITNEFHYSFLCRSYTVPTIA